MATQKALWLPKIGAEFILGQNEVPEPGPGEVLVKLEASALNPLDVEIQDSGFFEIEEYPAVLGEEGAGVVEKVGEGVTHLARGDKVFVHSVSRGAWHARTYHMHADRLFQTTLKNKFASFQEYCLVVAELATKVELVHFVTSSLVDETEDRFHRICHLTKPLLFWLLSTHLR